jgi:hypothetical protein
MPAVLAQDREFVFVGFFKPSVSRSSTILFLSVGVYLSLPRMALMSACAFRISLPSAENPGPLRARARMKRFSTL